MTQKTLDTWLWVLIYGGMLSFSLGWFVQSLSPALGWTLIAAGGAATTIGVTLIFVRSRSGP